MFRIIFHGTIINNIMYIEILCTLSKNLITYLWGSWSICTMESNTRIVLHLWYDID